MNVFITGAAGYIGGTVALRLINEGHAVRGLVRDPTKVTALASSGITPVLGDLDNSVLLKEEARQSDAVINTASSNHPSSIEAILEGLRGSAKPFLHTSGSGVVADDARGNAPSTRIFDDETPFRPGPHPFSKARRVLDIRILKAAKSAVRTTVLCPSMIYGTGGGLHAESIQIPMLIRQAQTSGIVRVIGRGLNLWSNVHVDDVAELYSIALEKAPAGAFYFVESGEAPFADIGAAIARRLRLGEVQSWTVEEATGVWGERFSRSGLGSNSRVRALRARRELDWSPRHSSVVEWVEKEMFVA